MSIASHLSHAISPSGSVLSGVTPVGGYQSKAEYSPQKVANAADHGLSVCLFLSSPRQAVKPSRGHGQTALPGDKLAVLASVFSEVRVGAAEFSVHLLGDSTGPEYPDVAALGPFWKTEAVPSSGRRGHAV